jgi:hypothetical protein
VAQISISDIRREIQRAAGLGSSPAPASAAPVGTLFHEVLAGLMSPQGWQAAIEPDDLDDVRTLTTYTYDNLLGPRLTEKQASLNEFGRETLHLWQATQAMCAWLASLLRTAENCRLIRYDFSTRAWAGAENLCRPELALQWEFREPDWSAPVLVSGVADALWRHPQTGRWCLVEYKLGKGSPEADLAQACLYHAMIAAAGLAAADGALAILSFQPELTERLFAGPELAAAQSRLRALIGRLAGVLPSQSSPLPQAPPLNPAHTDLGKRLVRSLKDYGVEVQWAGDVIAGPTFLRYPVIPARNLKKSAITSRAAELQMQLNLEAPPFIALAKGRLVIDIQRPDRHTVDFTSITAQLPSPAPAGSSQVPLGVGLDGVLQFVDLASPNNPHLLVAGTSGSGKSEWLRMAIAGLILANTPETLRLLLIDPKRNAFSELKTSPFLFPPKGLIYPPEDPALDSLDFLIEEMERRYVAFSQSNAGDLAEHTARTGQRLPRIICICDEYADLLSDRAAKKQVEAAINRLGAKARAAGIHLIIATQYPDRNTVAGALKMNLAGRVCLRTTNHTQSNMIINQSGAEHLLGKGDLFFLSIGEPVRLQAPYLSAESRARIFSHAETSRSARS